ncbi:MAG: type I 3-dehydroquinate dehydratase [Firmicutes bacterium]|nr:type I 3-dehydroquinate dehydratase [Bacillota bacterium]
MKLVVCLSARDRGDAVARLDLLEGLTYDFLEFRADAWDRAWTGEGLLTAVRAIKKRIGPHPLILTLRTAREGGEDPGMDEKKKAIILWDLLEVCPEEGPGPDLVDLEWSMGREEVKDLGDLVRTKRMGLILSAHRFDGPYSAREAEGLYLEMVEAGAGYQKLAFRVDRPEDLAGPTQGLARAMARRPDIRPILVGMGEAGRASRLPGPTNPSLWTFASLGKKTAPGQMEAEAVSRLLEKN